MNKLTLMQRIFINVKYYMLFIYWFLTASKQRHEWRRWWLVVFLFIISACSPIWEEGEKKLSVISSGKDMIYISTTTPTTAPESGLSTTTVTAERALRLRDLPESQGGTTLTIMPNGSEFTVSYCIEVSGTIWAYGSYKDSTGKHWLGYSAARYLQNACD